MSSAQPKQPAQSILTWLRANLGPRHLAPLTSTDTAALRAIAQVAQVAAFTRLSDITPSLLPLIKLMQSHTQHLAYHAIAHSLDWSDRDRVWTACGFTERPLSVCAFEPGSDYRDRSRDK